MPAKKQRWFSDYSLIVSCDKTVTFITKLYVRHESALLSKELHWLATPQDVREPLLCRVAHEALRLDGR